MYSEVVLNTVRGGHWLAGRCHRKHNHLSCSCSEASLGPPRPTNQASCHFHHQILFKLQGNSFCININIKKIRVCVCVRNSEQSGRLYKVVKDIKKVVRELMTNIGSEIETECIREERL